MMIVDDIETSFKTPPVRDLPGLAEFINNRAFYLTQAHVIDPMQAGAGLKWQRLIKDDAFSRQLSIKITKAHAAFCAALTHISLDWLEGVYGMSSLPRRQSIGEIMAGCRPMPVEAGCQGMVLPDHRQIDLALAAFTAHQHGNAERLAEDLVPLIDQGENISGDPVALLSAHLDLFKASLNNKIAPNSPALKGY